MSNDNEWDEKEIVIYDKPVISDKSFISFYREYDNYGELSNFYLLEKPIIYHNLKFRTSEHLYQALKYLYKNAPPENMVYVQEIANSSTPYKAKILSNRFLTHTIRYPWQNELCKIIKNHPNVIQNPNWNQLKLSAMLFVLKLKFNQDLQCKEVLFQTGTLNLIENSTDEFWGSGKSKKSGQNNLGKLLMMIRTKLFNF